MVHRSGVRRLKRRFGRRIDVEWLPAYSPDLNPDEQVWNHSKYSQLANFIPDDVDHLAKAVKISLRIQSRQQDLLRSFFQTAKLPIGTFLVRTGSFSFQIGTFSILIYGTFIFLLY
jgi:transposase